LARNGLEIHPTVAKATVQCARQSVQHLDEPGLEGLVLRVTEDLRQIRVHLVPRYVRRVLLSYGRLVADLDIAETIDRL